MDKVLYVSQWGRDFRSDCKKLYILREHFPKVLIIALTASATPRVQLDLKHLNLTKLGCVLHYSLLKSIEGYYQESGRAGRDGDISPCVLYYNYSDMLRLKKMLDTEKSAYEVKQIHLQNLKRMVGYCENVTDCRRKQQLN